MAWVRDTVKAPKLALCGVRYNSAPRPTHLHQMILDERRHQFRPAILQHYRELDRNQLRHQVEVNVLKATKAARVHCKRRLATAFSEALLEHGINRDGKRISDGQQVVKGHIQLIAKPAGLGASVKDAMPDMQQVVRYLFKICRYEGGKMHAKPAS